MAREKSFDCDDHKAKREAQSEYTLILYLLKVICFSIYEHVNLCDKTGGGGGIIF